jgi:hypothetical protein
MKTLQPGEYGYQRKLSFADIPEENPDGSANPLRELTVQIQYLESENDGSRVEKAITLDHCILPLLAKAPAMEEALQGIQKLLDDRWDGPSNDKLWVRTIRSIEDLVKKGLSINNQQA